MVFEQLGSGLDAQWRVQSSSKVSSERKCHRPKRCNFTEKPKKNRNDTSRCATGYSPAPKQMNDPRQPSHAWCQAEMIWRRDSFSVCEPSHARKAQPTQLNTQTPCPPRTAVPVNSGRTWEFFHSVPSGLNFGHGCDCSSYVRGVFSQSLNVRQLFRERRWKLGVRKRLKPLRGRLQTFLLSVAEPVALRTSPLGIVHAIRFGS